MKSIYKYNACINNMLLSKEYEEHLKLVAQSMENPEKYVILCLSYMTRDISGVETSASVAPTTKSILSTKLIEPLWLTKFVLSI